MPLFGALVGLGASLLGSRSQSKAADEATAAQTAASDAAIAETQRQFDIAQGVQAPFVGAGEEAIGGLQNLLGLGGPGSELAAIEGLEASPTFQALARQGEEAILQNAAATGGLRGGNTQAALSRFRPSLLNNLIQQRTGDLFRLSQLGQASASGTASAALGSGANVSNLLMNQGQVGAQGALAQGNLRANTIGDVGEVVGGQLGNIFGGNFKLF